MAHPFILKGKMNNLLFAITFMLFGLIRIRKNTPSLISFSKAICDDYVHPMMSIIRSTKETKCTQENPMELETVKDTGNFCGKTLDDVVWLKPRECVSIIHKTVEKKKLAIAKTNSDKDGHVMDKQNDM
ncbi:hypothetical protein CAPTEDRAFT_186652 [Capitella teleta]|uniref:Uncharacterized protein n=1 Tax=Capitella teleta TaxID=283909 RepID=R7TQU1_CAPTE|nr:hypothetical protein CAPTEDRAFT_186652 [Capitella teleta]|eukprot:ELT95932.1 hypothetical protein CAPTEDRAFT_186652 [Capitella teleta]